jgi:hypothetical protein
MRCSIAAFPPTALPITVNGESLAGRNPVWAPGENWATCAG